MAQVFNQFESSLGNTYFILEWILTLCFALMQSAQMALQSSLCITSAEGNNATMRSTTLWTGLLSAQSAVRMLSAPGSLTSTGDVYQVGLLSAFLENVQPEFSAVISEI